MTAWSAAEICGRVPDILLTDRPLRTMACACGLPITADPTDPRPGIEAHNARSTHREWRLRHENP